MDAEEESILQELKKEILGDNEEVHNNDDDNNDKNMVHNTQNKNENKTFESVTVNNNINNNTSECLDLDNGSIWSIPFSKYKPKYVNYIFQWILLIALFYLMSIIDRHDGVNKLFFSVFNIEHLDMTSKWYHYKLLILSTILSLCFIYIDYLRSMIY